MSNKVLYTLRGEPHVMCKCMRPWMDCPVCGPFSGAVLRRILQANAEAAMHEYESFVGSFTTPVVALPVSPEAGSADTESQRSPE